MACLGMQINSFGGRSMSNTGRSSEEIIGDFSNSMTLFGDQRRRRWLSPRMCVANLGELSDGAYMEKTAEIARTKGKTGSRQKKMTIAPHVDQLMEESISEIVKNLNGSPLLVQAYMEDENLNSSRNPLKLVMNKATSESWPDVTESWEDGINPTPDGVILVQELDGSDTAIDTQKKQKQPSSEKVWGLLVQSRGFGCPACYILKTCQVQCVFGLTTHYCLAKVDCFGQDADFHFNKMWLQS